MFGFFRSRSTAANFTKQPTMVEVTRTMDGRFALRQKNGGVISIYSRKRDAIRGATRRGLVVA